MSVTLISVSHDTVVSNKHEEQTRHYYVNFQQKHHELPRSITLDRGPQFAAQVMQEINKALGISTKLSMSLHPQTDGQTEIVNKEVQKFLWIYCFEKTRSMGQLACHCPVFHK